MKKIIQFREDLEVSNIHILNEGETRAAASILFVMMFLSILIVILNYASIN